jgi:hypothetical protein
MIATTLRGAALLVLGAVVASAQPERSSRDSLTWPVFLHGSIVQVRPLGDYAANTGLAYGGLAAVSVGVEPHGFFRVRASVGGVGYGSESKRVSLGPTIGDRINVKRVTNNAMWFGDIGGELTIPKGPVQPYVHAGRAYHHYTTDSHLDEAGGFDFDDDDDDRVFTTNNFRDGTYTDVRGGGVRMRLASRHGAMAMLDIGATRYSGGRARYLTPGSIEDRPDGSIVIMPHESDIAFTQIRIGLTLGR